MVTVDGGSVEPTFPKGSSIFLPYQPEIEDGDLAVVRSDDAAVAFKRLYFDCFNHTVTRHALNHAYEAHVFDCEDVSIARHKQRNMRVQVVAR
ncbi:S24 family peptidase [Lacticaseibacillus mingshuiensis]|uniref:Helix-turn-helix transcriptional regulator n=1 Tax=Lacticaseibacillus mingshuiensis TaxID=2799574 RepID=A0ABW4CIL9_9LACO